MARKLEFGGVIVSASQVDGKNLVEMEPALDKVEALMEMDRPKTVKQAQQVLGMVNQMSRWIPDLSLSIPNLKKSTSSRNKFQWSQALEMEWGKMMELLKTSKNMQKA